MDKSKKSFKNLMKKQIFSLVLITILFASVYVGSANASILSASKTNAPSGSPDLLSLNATTNGARLFSVDFNGNPIVWEGQLLKVSSSGLLIPNTARTNAYTIQVNSGIYKNGTITIPNILGTSDTFLLSNTTATITAPTFTINNLKAGGTVNLNGQTILNTGTLTMPTTTTTIAGLAVPETFSALQTFNNGITMSGSNIALGSNSITSPNYSINEATSGLLGVTTYVQTSRTNSPSILSISPTGTSREVNVLLYRTSAISTNTELFILGSDTVGAGNDFQLISYKEGTGINRPIDVYMQTTKLESFDAANTITNYVPVLLQNKITQYNNINTVANGIPSIVGIDSRTGVTTSDGTPITLYTVPAVSNTVFRVNSHILSTSYTSGSPAYNLVWTENGVTQSFSTAASTCNACSQGVDQIIKPDASTIITGQITGTFTATLKVAATVEQLN